jgi:hypothetical protein
VTGIIIIKCQTTYTVACRSLSNAYIHANTFPHDVISVLGFVTQHLLAIFQHKLVINAILGTDYDLDT